VVEYAGREHVVVCRAGADTSLTVRTTARVAPGDRAVVVADPARLLVFPLDDGPDEARP
jgi:putative spermidine/putrescine transport system ATP-binding protein